MPTVESIATDLLALLDDDVRADLAAEDPATAVEVHFPPVQVLTLPDAFARGENCSTDGFYEAHVDPAHPRIIFAADVAPARARFTILHELGHHLLATEGAHLLDQIDQVGRSAEGAAKVEELVCHEVAGRLLVPPELVAEVVGADHLNPALLIELRARSNASWEAIAVRATACLIGACAIVLTREPGVVAFSAARGLEFRWWPRGSALDPGGPLSRAVASASIALPDTYRWGLGYARRLFCDARPIREGLAIAVLGTRPSDGHFEILEDPPPLWEDRVELCEWCYVERTEAWCDRCKGRFCPECGRCGCSKPPAQAVCVGCGLQKPFRKGASVCYDCEADGVEG